MEVLEADPYSCLLFVTAHFSTTGVILIDMILPVGWLLFTIGLVICSAMLSGAESAYFSLKPEDIKSAEQNNSAVYRSLCYLHERPRLLLSTILIGNTLVNIMVAIVVTTKLIVGMDFGGNELLHQFVEVVVVTFTLVLFGEVTPKIYATQNNLQFSAFMALPLRFLSRVFYPLSYMLMSTSAIIEKKLATKGHNVSLDEIKHAIEITSGEETSQEEKQILKGIVNFGNIYVKQIMRSRMDAVAYDVNTPFTELIKEINENQYSRMPAFNGSFDKIEGILYIKDLLPYLSDGKDFQWKTLLRPPYFVPETKKIDTLLQEFKKKKVHMAIVVDEYGGTSGLVTLEDILEEIVGDIHDEFDEDEIYYSKLDTENFVFEGKTALTDVVRVMELNDEVFEDVRGEAETIGGMIVEIAGKIPENGDKLNFNDFLFTVELADKRRVRRVKVTKNVTQTVINEH